MAALRQSSSDKKKQPKAVLSSKTIEEQTKAFLEAGGKVDYIKPGVSGQQNQPGPKHIKLGKPGS